jgi:hypothetical protein
MAAWDRERGTFSGRSTARDMREVFDVPEDRLQSRTHYVATIEEALAAFPNLSKVFEAADAAIPVLTLEMDVSRRELRRDFEGFAKWLGYDAAWRKANYPRFLELNPVHRHTTAVLFSHGHLWLHDSEPPDEKFLAVAQRFAGAVDFAYSRFLELKQKEDQNRELMIQNALERVRSQALGMRESDSLESVTVVLHEQFVSLGLQTVTTVIEVVDPENEWVRTSSYMAASGSSPWMTVPFETYKAEPTSARTLEAYERGDTSFTFQ